MTSQSTGQGTCDLTEASSAGVWNYLAGGSHHGPADRFIGDRVTRLDLNTARIARVSQRFRVRAVRCLVDDENVRQFMDVGAGYPLPSGNTHEAAERCRVLYVDNDPEVLAARRRAGTALCHEGDLREPRTMLRAAEQALDLDQPVALLLMGVLGHFGVYEEALESIGVLMGGLPSGSFLIHYDATSGDAQTSADFYNAQAPDSYHLRTLEQIRQAFDGLELLPPGLVRLGQWRPDGAEEEPLVDAYGAVDRKP